VKNLAPTTTAVIPDQAGAAGGPDVNVNLTNFFDDARRSVRLHHERDDGEQRRHRHSVVRQDRPGAGQSPTSSPTSITPTPTTDYDGSIFHRVRTIRACRSCGRGFNFNPRHGLFGQVPNFQARRHLPADPNEPQVSNTRARLDGQGVVAESARAVLLQHRRQQHDAGARAMAGRFTAFARAQRRLQCWTPAARWDLREGAASWKLGNLPDRPVPRGEVEAAPCHERQARIAADAVKMEPS